ncbi:MAG: transcription antitermination factor NusB [Nocardioides sp.]
MGARSKSRKRALDVLFAADMRGQSPREVLERTVEEAAGPFNPYVETLVRAVSEHREVVDRLLGRYSEAWTLDRMPVVDRNVLRLGVVEILFSEEIPGPVAISEALALVTSLSTEESPAFVNGVLGAILRDKDALLVEFTP